MRRNEVCNSQSDFSDERGRIVKGKPAEQLLDVGRDAFALPNRKV